MKDTTGRSLESLDSLFQRPWYTVWKVAYATPEEMKLEGKDGVSGKEVDELSIQGDEKGNSTRVESRNTRV